MTKYLLQFMAAALRPVLLIMIPLLLIPALILLLLYLKKNKEYKSGTYYEITKLPYLSVRFDLGRHGEYLIYKRLKDLETSGAKFLFNVYIPKSSGETTEIDVLMICSKGLFVFESKNYSGWIFGSEAQKNWYQTLPSGRGKSHKEAFYNPIMQNRSHIKHLKAFLNDEIPMRSIIVFSERCTLKNVQVKSEDIRVIQRQNVMPTVSELCSRLPLVLSENDITVLYDKLYPFTQVDEAAKAQHIDNIRNIQAGQPVRQTEPQDAPPAAEQTEVISGHAEPVSETEPTEQFAAEPEIAEQSVLKCPKCGGDLILRTASRGANAGKQFYGCSNYPKCKYIQNITEKV